MMQALLVLIAVFTTVLFQQASTAPANPEPAVYQDPDGLATPALFLQGDEHFSCLTDEEGFTVVKDREGFYVYADKGNDGRLKASARRVGFTNPNSLNLKKNLKPDKDKLPDDALKSNEKPSKKAYELWKQSSPRKAENTTGLAPVDRKGQRQLWFEPIAPLCDYTGTPSSPCFVKHLVVLVQFADHAERELPPRSSYETLFNDENSESIRHYFKANSHGSLILNTHVTDLVQVSKTEEYTVANEYNENTARRNHSLQWQESRPNSRNMERSDADSRRSKL
jgi:hypothetical protein